MKNLRYYYQILDVDHGVASVVFPDFKDISGDTVLCEYDRGEITYSGIHKLKEYVFNVLSRTLTPPKGKVEGDGYIDCVEAVNWAFYPVNKDWKISDVEESIVLGRNWKPVKLQGTEFLKLNKNSMLLDTTVDMCIKDIGDCLTIGIKYPGYQQLQVEASFTNSSIYDEAFMGEISMHDMNSCHTIKHYIQEISIENYSGITEFATIKIKYRIYLRCELN